MPYGTPFSAILCRSAQAPRKTLPTGHRPAEAGGGRRALQNPRGLASQLERVGRNGRSRPRGLSGGMRPEPMPYGTPFSAILCRSAQAPRKTLPTGHRPAEASGGRRALQNPRGLAPQLERVGRNGRSRPRGLSGGVRREPMPSGTPFSAILCRSAQAPRKTLPTGHRPAEAGGRARKT